ncbi:hypothetical protein SAMN05216184_103143 [Georgenia satyanarayanai]|uniref:Repeat domain-containing protein n=1 Tax=Georgenia satyanarayanai TaxID=860221 RepID=A0A2Y9A6B0_9MICO|nr:hypothetical protein [Georgenia satyanarayanai]PYG00572.1 hypothetical protein A8987_103143 [Georgenia satyanarayanai]SSA39961.1 hypothetical protein SAMN05216184_103143 [Georgenia satyanarayanai]
MHGPSRAGRGCAAALLATALVLTSASAGQAAPDSPVVVDGEGWSVEQAPGGYVVTLELDEPLPVRAAVPQLVADGEPLGLARESLDGLSLSAVTTDDAVLDAEEITLSWGEEDQALRSSGSRTTGPQAVDPEPGDREVLDVDPAQDGDYTVGRADYDLGTQAVDLVEIGGIKGEMRAAVYYPVEAQGERPVVVFQHGRHGSCSQGTPNPNRYPCGPDQVEIPSYLGYDAPAETLASLGYVVVSVSANAINSNDNQLAIDYGATARGGLVLSHLDLLAEANAGTAPELDPVLRGRLDLDRVGLMGHSRGGDGVVRAALMNAERTEPYGIESVLPLAPVDFGRLSLPGVPTYTVLPYCDGDVVNLQGQHFFEDSRYAVDDDVLRATALVMGANHNFFNTVWTPGLYPYSVSDDWAFQDRSQTNTVCGASAEPRLPAAEQYALGDAYISGWFRLTMGGEEELLPLFDGSGALPASIGDAEVFTVAQQPGSSRVDVAPLTADSPRVRAAGGARLTYCASLSERPYPQQVSPCADIADVTSSQAPHWTPMRFAPSAPAGQMAILEWSTAGAGLRADVPAGARDVTDLSNLTFRAAPTLAGAQDLTVTLVDGAGRSASALVSEVSEALSPLPGEASPLRKVYLRAVEIPLSTFEGVELTDVRQVRLAGVGDSGAAYLSDLTFSSPAVGSPGTGDIPSLTVADATVNEGTGPGTAAVALRLSAPSATAVRTYVEANGGETGAQRLAAPVVIPAGQTCVVFDVPLEGDRRTATVPTTSVTVTAAAVVGASSADTFGQLSVREDDAVVDRDGIVHDMAPDPGPQGDVCATAPEEPGEPTEPTEPGTPALTTGFFLNDGWGPWATYAFRYGRATDEVLVGDWDGDSNDTITLRRGRELHVSDAQRGGDAARVFSYGRAGDVVLVGDWDGDGVDTLAVRRGNEYHLKNSVTGGAADVVVRYGRAGDEVVVGDWDGDGKDTLAVRRGKEYHVRNSLTAGPAQQVLTYGRATDVVLAGDWDADGKDTFAVRRGNVYHVKNAISGGDADRVQSYGRAADEVFVGDWNGDGRDTLGVRRTS